MWKLLCLLKLHRINPSRIPQCKPNIMPRNQKEPWQQVCLFVCSWGEERNGLPFAHLTGSRFLSPANLSLSEEKIISLFFYVEDEIDEESKQRKSSEWPSCWEKCKSLLSQGQDTEAGTKYAKMQLLGKALLCWTRESDSSPNFFTDKLCAFRVNPLNWLLFFIYKMGIIMPAMLKVWG